SAGHIAHVGHVAGLGNAEAKTLFIVIDIPVLVGKLLSTEWFAPTTRREGRRLMYSFILASLALNVASGLLGGGYGAAGYGALIVCVAIWMERVIGRIKPAGKVTKAKNEAKVEAPAPKRTPRKRT